MKQLQYHMISDRKLYCEPLVEIVSEAEKAGIDYFQLREKDLSLRDLFSVAQKIRALLRKTQLIINGSLAVALACKADGVHLQDGNIPVSAVRAGYKELIIGYSAHSLEEMKAAESEGADYVFVSPVFRPISKSSYEKPHGISVVSSWLREMRIPVFALGGISAQNVSEVMNSGCAGVAGISLFLDNGRFAADQLIM